jgi:hypothetical protein
MYNFLKAGLGLSGLWDVGCGMCCLIEDSQVVKSGKRAGGFLKAGGGWFIRAENFGAAESERVWTRGEMEGSLQYVVCRDGSL